MIADEAKAPSAAHYPGRLRTGDIVRVSIRADHKLSVYSRRMKRPIRIAYVILAVVLAAYALDVWHMARQRAHEKREELYQANLQRYSKVAIPGMTRTQVESYLRDQSTSFERMCCVEEQSALADLVLLGRERLVFPCDSEGIYIAFQFAATEQHDGMMLAYDSDVLKRVSIYRWMQGCL